MGETSSSPSSVRQEGRRSFLTQGEKELPGEVNIEDVVVLVSIIVVPEDFSSIIPMVTFIPKAEGPLENSLLELLLLLLLRGVRAMGEEVDMGLGMRTGLGMRASGG